MKLTRFLILTILFASILFHANVSAQDYTQWNLPEGAKARLGKGTITGDIQYSPDGSLLAVPSSIGVWLYNAQTHEEINLLVGHTAQISVIAFSPRWKYTCCRKYGRNNPVMEPTYRRTESVSERTQSR